MLERIASITPPVFSASNLYMRLPWMSKEGSRWSAVGSLITCEILYTYSVLMERRGLKSPLLMVCSLLSYNDSRLRFCRSWKVLTLKQLILLAFSNLKHTVSFLLFTLRFVHLYKLIILSLTQKHKYTWRFLFVYLKRAKPFVFSFPSLTLWLLPPFPTLLPQFWLFLLVMRHKLEDCSLFYLFYAFLLRQEGEYLMFVC